MTPAVDTAGGLHLVAASAGSGKTHTITAELARAVDPAGERPLAPESLVAVTYTRKAATELIARMRRTLICGGAHDRAQRLPLAYLGTVHAVCLRLVQEFALDAGLSPRVDVLSGDERRLLHQALENSLTPKLRLRIDELAHRLEIRWDGGRGRSDWLLDVEDIMTLARSNRIAPGALAAMAARSADGLLAVMGPAFPDGDALDRELATVLRASAVALDRIDDGQKNTRRVKELIGKLARRAEGGPLPWSDWIMLQNVQPGTSAQAAVTALIDIASRVDQHPRLQSELRETVIALYEAARQGLDGYDAWKRRRRVVDFVDMVDQALTLVEQKNVAAELRSKLELFVVDEFQDTSPLQLALFAQLHQITRRSIWVGDRKQCIFEFAGADPGLMDAVVSWVTTAGGTTSSLDQNWRSRPELVDACSRLFAAALARHGYGPQEVVVTATRNTPVEQQALPPFGLWWLESNTNEAEASALAEGVRRLLASPAATPVLDTRTKQVRPLIGGDVAILVATNAEAARVAKALGKCGIEATFACDGLLATPEATLLRAALGFLLDERDTVSRATIDALTGFNGTTREEWLDRQIAAHRAYEDGQNPAAPPSPSASDMIVRLRELRSALELLTPSEVIDRVLAKLDFATLCRRWPGHEQRLGNIDALRGLTAAYETRSAHVREVATLAGLLRFFTEVVDERFSRGEERAADDQHFGGSKQAVVVATFHKAKGLEWPVVVLASLDRTERRDAFDVSPETDNEMFDAATPLSGRWIRCWPWPYGAQKKTRLADAAGASAVGRAVAQREERERVRLLYVGFTRARDHLILAARCGSNGPAVRWLRDLCDADGKPLLELPADPNPSGNSEVVIRDRNARTSRVPARHWVLGPGSAERSAVIAPATCPWPARPNAPAPGRPPYWVAPSRAAVDWPELAVPNVGDVEIIGERLPLGSARDVDWDVVGSAIHAFLAADVCGLSLQERLTRAENALASADLGGLLTADGLLGTGDRLRCWLDTRWRGARWHRELPVSAAVETPLGRRRVEGTIDLLLETPRGAVIIDHKSFPGPQTAWRDRAREYAPQLQAYAHVVEAAGIPVIGKWLHFSVGGGVIGLR